MALSDLLHYVCIDRLSSNRFDSSNQLEKLVSMLVEKVCKHPNLRELVSEITSINEAKGNLIELENTFKQKVFLMESGDETTVKMQAN